MMTIGIDPGISGAVVALENGAPVEWLRMPVMSGGGKSRRVNTAALAAWIADRAPAAAFVEAVGAMPGQGVASMFTFGRAAGAVDGVLGALGVPVTYLTPQAWKRAAGLIGKDKDAARGRAVQIWPAWRALDKKGEGQALADAALIAWAGGRAC